MGRGMKTADMALLKSHMKELKEKPMMNVMKTKKTADMVLLKSHTRDKSMMNAMKEMKIADIDLLRLQQHSAVHILKAMLPLAHESGDQILALVEITITRCLTVNEIPN